MTGRYLSVREAITKLWGRCRHTFLSAAAATADPHQGIQKGVSFITSLHSKVETVFVTSGVDSISHRRVVDLFQNVLGAGEPAIRFDDNESWGLVGSLEEVIRADAGCGILGHNLSILSTGLFIVSR